MESTTLNVRVDSKDKKNFEDFCSSVGMNVSTAINMYIKAVLREQKLPFDIKSYSYNDYVSEKLREAEYEMEHNSVRYSVAEVEEDVNKIINNKKNYK